MHYFLNFCITRDTYSKSHDIGSKPCYRNAKSTTTSGLKIFIIRNIFFVWSIYNFTFWCKESQSEMKTSFIFDPFKTREKWRERIWIPIQDGSKVINTKYYISVISAHLKQDYLKKHWVLCHVLGYFQMFCFKCAVF